MFRVKYNLDRLAPYPVLQDGWARVHGRHVLSPDVRFTPFQEAEFPVAVRYAWRTLVIRRNKNNFLLYWRLDENRVQVYDGGALRRITVISMDAMGQVTEDTKPETTLIVYGNVG